MAVVQPQSGNFRPGTRYTVLTAGAGVNGTYGGTAIPVSAFLALQDSYDAHNVYLNVTQTRDPGEAAQTPNQGETAGGVTGATGETVLNAGTDAEARAMLDKLSGEAQASAKGALISSAVLVRNTVNDRLRDAFCAGQPATKQQGLTGATVQDTCAEGIAAWAQVMGGWGNADGGTGISRVHQSNAGFLLGSDTAVGNGWRAGAFAGYSHTKFDVNALDSSGGSDSYHLGVYGGRQWERLALRLGSSYTWNNIDTRRSVQIGSLANDLRANYSAGTTQLFSELGYGLDAGRVSVEPFVSLAYVNLHTQGFKESGGDAALASRASTSETWFTTLGLRPSVQLNAGRLNGVVRGVIGWRHAFGNTTPTSTVAFAGGNPFTVNGAVIATNAAVVEIGADLQLARNSTLSFSYGGQFSGNAIDQSLRANLAVRF